MNLLCLGLNHRTASVDVREKLWFSDDDARRLLSMLRDRGVEEAVLLSTCNRTELYYVPSAGQAPAGDVTQMFYSIKGAGDSLSPDAFYRLPSLHAVHHLFKLASGIDSMVLGDVQIIHQMKNALAIAREMGTVGSLLNKIFAAALHTGKRVRSETGVAEGSISVGYSAAELAAKIFSDLSQRTAMLIGAGETGELTAKHLHANGLGRLLVVNRTRERAAVLAAKLGGEVVGFDEFHGKLRDADIVVCCVSGSEHVVSAAHLREAMNAHGNRPLVVIDLGMPRNIDPEANALPNVFLHDLDSLNGVVDRNLARRKADVPDAQRIILDELRRVEQWHRSLRVAPTIQDLRDYAEDIRNAEVEKLKHRFAEEDQEELSLLTRRIVNKILHVPTVMLRESSSPRDSVRVDVDMIRSLFGLNRAE